jgi:hypothetical protein
MKDIHAFFGLTYSSYLVLPRTMLQSMPDKWQEQFVKLIEEIDKTLVLPTDYTGNYVVTMKNGKKYAKDSLRNYERGRRRLPIK